MPRQRPKGYAPTYDILVWNRTDLTQSQGNLTVSYQAAKKGPLYENFPPDGYKGETIPPYAVMRTVCNAVIYKDEWCYPVCRPDDNSQASQVIGSHFVNGPSPIPLGGYGRVTRDLPVPVLCDLTVGSQQATYGNAGGVVPSKITNTGFGIVGLLMGYMSGSWALHPAADIISYNSLLPTGLLKLGNVSIPGGTVEMLAVTMPYVVLSQNPIPLANPKTIQPTDSPTLQFNYSADLMIVGTGALGYGSVTAT